MKKFKTSRFYYNDFEEDDGRKVSKKALQRDKAKKQERNLKNAIRSKNLDALRHYEDD